MNKQVIVIFTCLVLFCACNQTEGRKIGIKTHQIDYQDARKESLAAIPDSILAPPQYILIKESSIELMCQQVNKVKYRNNRFYMLDIFLRKLIVCDSLGTVLNQVGNRGNGPGEYMSITDFDIDSKGYIYCLDGKVSKLFIYDQNLKVINTLKLPFQADIVQTMTNGDLLFGLSSWNEGKGKGYKLTLTDKDLNIRNTFLPYDEYKDDNYWISLHPFTIHNNIISYNQPIDNNAYRIPSERIDSIESYLFDFGSRNVPNEDKKNIERNLKSFDTYTLLKSPIVTTPDYIAGTLLDGRKTRFFIFDIKNNISYEGEKTEEYDNSQLVGYDQPYIISLIEPIMELPEDCTYPDSVKNHLLNEGRVIVLRQLQST